MRLHRRPFRPKWSTTAQILLGTAQKYREWDPFLRAS
jgi:hypothetical protein